MARKADLVDRIKSLQRTDENAKQAWWSYCEEQHSGVKDPNRHDEYTLSNFLSTYESGGCSGGRGYTPSRPQQRSPTSRFSSQIPSAAYTSSRVIPAGAPRLTPSARPVMAAAVMSPMAEVVKVGQRASPNWRAAWQTFCSAYGNSINDPAKHPETFLRQFFDFVGEVAQRELELGGVVVEEPPSKRPRFDAPAAEYADGHKQALVDKIKVLQRSDQTAKEAWWAFCDLTNKGIRDPMRHQTQSLEQFLEEQGQL
ncbi:unnamed protein product [Symbiodinium pilosum]|uniref:Uncharacterized protein n=1 Tax=Symbiodinium pilosum TaxID=2952 RepID=A0A812IV20_SYMPI|nr:unnamed protein product [Symbiodinium pilosum]